MPSVAYAEIIESSLHTWRSCCWKWDVTPQFGSLVCIEDRHRILFGLVHQITTGPLDSTRMPYPFQKTEEELRREQPQIFTFLRTTFTCVTIGYLTDNIMRYQWAPEPPKIHAFVTPATDAQYQMVFANEQYVQVLFGASSQLMNLDELLLALIKQLTDRHLFGSEQLQRFVETFSLLTGNDYRRLKLFLQRIAPYVKQESITPKATHGKLIEKEIR